MALETNHEAYLPVTLSLVKLYARSVWHILTGGGQKSLNLFLGDPDSDDHWYLGKAKAEFKKKVSGGTKGQIDGRKPDEAGTDGETENKFPDVSVGICMGRSYSNPELLNRMTTLSSGLGTVSGKSLNERKPNTTRMVDMDLRIISMLQLRVQGAEKGSTATTTRTISFS